MKKNYSLIDIVKLFFAIGIVCIHSEVFENTSSLLLWVLQHAVFKIAVPFFFVASGFFLEKKLLGKVGKELIKKYFKRLLIPFGFWLIVNYYFTMTSWNCHGILDIVLTTIRNLLFYPWGAMWYVLALMVAILIILPFYRRGKTKKIMIIGALLYLFALLCNNYYFVLEDTPISWFINKYLNIAISPRNGLFEGLYFVSCGMYISELLRKKQINYQKNNIIFGISYILFIAEIMLIYGLPYRDDHSLFIMLYTLIPSMFIFFLQFNVNFKSTLLRNYSTGIYFSHRFILNIVNLLIPMLSLSINKLELFGIVMAIDFIILMVLYKINNKFINYLIK